MVAVLTLSNRIVCSYVDSVGVIDNKASKLTREPNSN